MKFRALGWFKHFSGEGNAERRDFMVLWCPCGKTWHSAMDAKEHECPRCRNTGTSAQIQVNGRYEELVDGCLNSMGDFDLQLFHGVRNYSGRSKERGEQRMGDISSTMDSVAPMDGRVLQ